MLTEYNPADRASAVQELYSSSLQYDSIPINNTY